MTSSTTATTQKPHDSEFYQQRLPVFLSHDNRTFFSIFLIVLGITFLVAGSSVRNSQMNVYEQSVEYDGNSNSVCHIDNRNEGRRCQVNFTFTEDVSDELYVYYRLSNFYQNHRRYVASYSIAQLQGQNLNEGGVSLFCNPLLKNGSLLLNPCGLVANSFFNDVITVNNASTSVSGVYMSESGIALKVDRDTMFKQVSGFQSLEIPCGVTSCDAMFTDGCKFFNDTSSGLCYQYYYPDDDTVQYLYESYPDQISPINGVTDEHFIVWMRPQGLPTFRKLYGKIKGISFSKGDVLSFNIVSNFEVMSFDGTKSLLISTVGSLGGKNFFPSTLLLVVGSLCLARGILMTIYQYRHLLGMNWNKSSL